MDRQHFTAGVIPEASDFNALSTNTLGGFYQLLSAMGGSGGSLLFEDAPPTVNISANVLEVAMPAQYVAVEGHVTQSLLFTQNVVSGAGPAPDAIKGTVFIVVGEDGSTAVRNFLSKDPTTGGTIKQTLQTTIKYTTTNRVVLNTSTNLIDPIAPPTLTASDAGFIEVGTFVWDEVDLVITPNTAQRFQIPSGAVVPLTAHGPTHLEDGDDPIPTAALGAVSGGSTPGLVPYGGYNLMKGSYQAITSATNNEFIVVTPTGTNDIVGESIDPKTAKIGVNLGDGLTKVTDLGVYKLGVDFPDPSDTAGDSPQAARANHKHSINDMGFVYATIPITISEATELGALIAVNLDSTTLPPDTSVSEIINVELYWGPLNPTVTSASNRIRCGWDPINGIGARAIILGPHLLSVETGASALTYLTAPSKNLANTWTTGGSLSTTPTVGMLYVHVIAKRSE